MPLPKEKIMDALTSRPDPGKCEEIAAIVVLVGELRVSVILGIGLAKHHIPKLPLDSYTKDRVD